MAKKNVQHALWSRPNTEDGHGPRRHFRAACIGHCMVHETVGKRFFAIILEGLKIINGQDHNAPVFASPTIKLG